MHEKFLNYPGSDIKDYYEMLDADTLSRWKQIDPEREPRLMSWGKLPKGIDPSQIKFLRLLHDKRSVVKVPEIIFDLPNLTALSLPRRMVGCLDKVALQPSLRTLDISGDGSATIGPTVEHTGLERLHSDPPGLLRFEASQFPNLRDVCLRIDRGRSVLGVLKGLERLVALNIMPCSDQEVLSALVALDLQYLRINDGHLDSLEPLRNARTITNLHLQSLSELTSLEPLTGMPNLRELFVSYCSKLKLDESLLKIKKLRKVAFWACGKIGLDTLEPKFKRILDLEETSGTR